MPEAIKTITTRHRGARGAAIAATCGLAGASDDRTLIAKCEQFQRDLDTYLVDCEALDDVTLPGAELARVNARLNGAHRRHEAMVLAIAAQPAHTQAGHKAKAQALISYQSRMVDAAELDFDRIDRRLSSTRPDPEHGVAVANLSPSAQFRKHIGKLLREARLAADLTQMDVARQMKKNQSHISEVERGVRNITLDTLCAIAEAVGEEPVVGLLDKPTRGRNIP